MDDESISFVSGDALSKLLQRPIRSGMLGKIEVKNRSACDFDDHEHLDQLRCCRDNEKAAGNDCFSMVAHEGHPALRRVDRTFGGFGHLTSNRPRRNPNANLKQQFASDPFFTPGRILRRHLDDQLP